MSRGSHHSHEEIRIRHNHTSTSRTFAHVCTHARLSEKQVLDVGCGYGEYLAHFGKGSVGLTTTKEEVAYGKEKRLAILLGNAESLEALELQEHFEAVWANNIFEHLLAPHEFLMNLKTVTEKQAILVLGVPVIPACSFLMRFKKFRGALASNHINFFTKDTLRLTCERAGWSVRSIRPFIFTNAFLDGLVAPLAPHLYVVADNNATFTYPEKKIKEWEGDPRYKKLLDSTHQSV